MERDSRRYVKAHGTSSKCSVCVKRLNPEEDQMMHCVRCDIHVDRDVNASANILNKGLHALARGARVTPDGASGEVMVTARIRRVREAQLTV